MSPAMTPILSPAAGGAAEQAAQGRVGQHRLDARQGVGLEALVGDFDEHPAEEAQPPLGGGRRCGAGAGPPMAPPAAWAPRLPNLRTSANRPDRKMSRLSVSSEVPGPGRRRARSVPRGHPWCAAGRPACRASCALRRPGLALAGEGRVGLFAGGLVGAAAGGGRRRSGRRAPAVARGGVEAQQVAHQPAAGVGDQRCSRAPWAAPRGAAGRCRRGSRRRCGARSRRCARRTAAAGRPRPCCRAGRRSRPGCGSRCRG
jgi:hypothetical protein